MHIGGVFQEKKIQASIMAILLNLNENKKRGDANYDKAFIKALIIGLFSTKNVRDGKKMHDDLKAFIKGTILLHYLHISISI